jgi:hypothetical protein
MVDKDSNRTKVCGAIVFFWVLAIAQYAYRYILQVNDPRTSHLYSGTPAVLSAIKYALLAAFTIYALTRRPVMPWRLSWRIAAGCCASLILVLCARIYISDGDVSRDTIVCAAEFIPWMCSVFIVPSMLMPHHTIDETLSAFERVSFWVVWPFWCMTVVLALTGIRYPALSYPGLLLRFGGIIDDPNGYAVLCLLWLMLSSRHRIGHWRLRAGWYLIMLLMTLSISGYVTAFVMLGCKLAAWTGKMKLQTVKLGFACALIACALPLYKMEQAAEKLRGLYESKNNSAETHLAELVPKLDDDLPDALLGRGGFSENFYWRIMANFGLIGLLVVGATVVLWAMKAGSLSLWAVALLIGSNGIAYLLVFPVNLIWWSAIACNLSLSINSTRRFDRPLATRPLPELPD